MSADPRSRAQRRRDTEHPLVPYLPRRNQARREVNELSDRELMRDGRWLV